MDDLITTHEPIEDCDCHQCAKVYRDKYKAALAGISEEMGLPLMMGPAKGDLKRLLDNGKAAIDKLRLAQIATSAEADFEAMTWTFEIAPDCRVGGGTYALVWMGPNVQIEAPSRPLAKVASNAGLGDGDAK